MFQGIIIRNEPAFRPRPTSVPGYHKFSQGRYGAFVAVTAFDAIAREARQAAPNETIGYLVGRPFRDAEGRYAMVTDAIMATSARRMPTTVETSLDDEQQLLDTLLADYPTCEKMGWFHSHPFSMGFYSGTDEENQRFWSESYQLGLLATLERESDTVTIHAFRGPESERLQPSYTTEGWLGSKSSVPATTFRPFVEPEVGERSEPQNSPPRRWTCPGPPSSVDPAAAWHAARQKTQRSSRRWACLATAGIAVCIIGSVAYLVAVRMSVHKVGHYAVLPGGAIAAATGPARSGRASHQDSQELPYIQQELSRISGDVTRLDAKLQKLQADVKQLRAENPLPRTSSAATEQSQPAAKSQHQETVSANEKKG